MQDKLHVTFKCSEKKNEESEIYTLVYRELDLCTVHYFSRGKHGTCKGTALAL